MLDRPSYVGGGIAARARSCSSFFAVGSVTRSAALRSASCCAERISAAMILTARSFCLRLMRPAMRYQTDVARSWTSTSLSTMALYLSTRAYERAEHLKLAGRQPGLGPEACLV